MSADTIRGLPVQDWQGSTFDPTNRRVFSILPDCDADEAHCVRHERDMPAVRTVYHHDGALYTTADGWDIYSCPDCCREVGPQAKRAVQQYIAWAFRTYDDTETEMLDGAFRYIGEADTTDVNPGVSVDE